MNPRGQPRRWDRGSLKQLRHRRSPAHATLSTISVKALAPRPALSLRTLRRTRTCRPKIATALLAASDKRLLSCGSELTRGQIVEAIQAAGPPVVPAACPFDPFSPNVIVVVRKSGRDAALAALGSIDSVDQLRLLAREQRLAVPADLSSVVELRTAIVAAAERRITNRIAAAS